ncbi:methylase [Streptomyces zinciresistens K42]|uniref:Methylase n=1 Tax=Streptomyces zinciresistens K42 TaxID=700597 RepID=G2GKQ3_9ACTN|nr:methylase [Streptomyces zinciresistens K42]
MAALRAAGCVFAEDEARLIRSAAATPDELAAMVDRRVTGLPIELVVGWARFRGLRIAVAPGVFVPRRRTEFLVEQALAHVPGTHVSSAHVPGIHIPDTHVPGTHVPGTHVVVDLCCGSGAVGAALADALGPVELHAADIDPAAVRCARGNLAAFGGQVHRGDLFEALPRSLRGRVDVLAANVPYVPSGEVGLLPAEARDHEPHVALDGGPDGLDILRRVAAEAHEWLAPGGCLLVETSELQAPAALECFAEGGLAARLVRSEELYAQVVVGRRPAAPGARAPEGP